MHVISAVRPRLANFALLFGVLCACFKTKPHNARKSWCRKSAAPNEQGSANVNNPWRLQRQLAICLFYQRSQGASENNNVMMPVHIISQWSDQQTIIIRELEQKAGAAWATTCQIVRRQTAEAFARQLNTSEREICQSISIKSRQAQVAGPSANVKQKSTATFSQPTGQGWRINCAGVC